LPTFKVRHSRNLGPGMVLLFQPRSVFVDTITNKVIGREARNQVRKRLETWDEVSAHPDLGFYGDPGNLEWKQYFLTDENVAAEDRCPFLKRKKAQAAADAEAPPRGHAYAPRPVNAQRHHVNIEQKSKRAQGADQWQAGMPPFAKTRNDQSES
jgi:uncharacterized protein